MSSAVTAAAGGEGLIAWYRANGITVDHPVVKLPTEAQVTALLAGGDEGKAQLKEVLDQREKLIKLMKEDPLNYGWEPQHWKDARRLMLEAGKKDLLIMGGNRSAKTEFAAKEAVLDMVSKPNRIWAFFQESEDASRRLQHPRVYQFLPREWKDLGKRGKTVFVCFTEKGGFTDNIFILPNGSRGYFFNYKQDVKVLEGYELDGIWADELVPPEFVTTLRFRLVTRGGRMILTFTPKDGYTPTVGDYLAAARVVEARPSELLPGENVKGCPPGHMPYIMDCVNPRRSIIFFYTQWNKFNPYAELKGVLEGASTGEIKIRAYGYPDRRTGNIFPKFGQHNIVPEGRVREMLREPHTLYCYADFAWARNWLIQWFAVWEYKGKKRVMVIAEWPDFQTYGEWVVPSKKPDGDRGPAQQPIGNGFKDYKKLIREMERTIARWEKEKSDTEGTEEEAQRAQSEEARREPRPTRVRPAVVFQRRCDPRSGKAAALSDEGGTCIMDKMQENHSGGDGEDDDLGPMYFLPAAGDNITEGVNAINAWLEYDESKPVDVMNEPVFYVSERCRNLIDCMRMWTGADGQKGAAKDPIDLPRYAAVDDIGYVDPADLGSEGGGSY